MSTSAGLVMAVISMICNGSFPSFNKLHRVQQCGVQPQVFNLYFIMGAVLSSIVVYIVLISTGAEVEFTYLGVISGLCLAICGVTTFAAIKYIGLSMGVTIWSGTAILVSFVQGFIAGTQASNLWIAIVGCLVLIAGIVGVGFSDKVVAKCSKQQSSTLHTVDMNKSNAPGAYRSEVEAAASSSSDDNVDEATKSLLAKNDREQTAAVPAHYHDYALGAFFAVLTGIFGGSVGFPTNWTDDDCNCARLKFLISFAVGCLLVVPITAAWALCSAKGLGKVEWHLQTCLVPGLLAGVVWNCANVASYYAIESLSYGVAYPIMQSSLVIANLWGVFVFKEVTDKKVICALFVCAFVVMGGCGLITVGVIGV